MIDLTNLRSKVFGRKVDLPAQATAYKRAFGSPDGKRYLLPDLLDFTGFARPAPENDSSYVQGRVQGRRDVMLRILEHISLTPEEIYAMLKGQPVIKPGDFNG